MLSRVHAGRYGVLQKSIIIPPHKLSALESGLKYYAESRISAKTVAEVSERVFHGMKGVFWGGRVGGGGGGRKVGKQARRWAGCGWTGSRDLNDGQEAWNCVEPPTLFD
jgi:hypothetical protein